MKKWLVLLMVCLVAFGTVAGLYSVSGAEGDTQKNGLSATLETDKDRYKEGEQVKATVSLTNESEKSASVSLTVVLPEGLRLITSKNELQNIVVPAGKTVKKAFRVENYASPAFGVGAILALSGGAALLVGGGVAALLLVKKKKKKNAVVSMILCVLFLALSLPAGVVAGAEETDGIDFTVERTLRASGRNVTLAVRVTDGAPGAESNFDPDSMFYDFYAENAEILVGTEGVVTFFAVTLDGSVDEGTDIELCDGNGKKVGLMFDDGTNGDPTPGDGVYAAELTVSSEEQAVVSYYARYKKKTSRSAEVVFYLDLTEEELGAGGEILDEIRALVADYVETGDPDSDEKLYEEAAEKVRAFLKDEKKKGTVVDYSENGESFVFFTYGNLEYRFPYTALVASENTFDSGSRATAPIPGESPICSAPGEIIGNGGDLLQVCFLSPFDWQQKKVGAAGAVRSVEATELGYRCTTELRNGEVTVQAMANLQPYRVIIIVTHGGVNCVCTGQKQSGENDIPLSVKRQSGDVIVVGVSGDEDGNYYALESTFFDHVYKRNELNNCLIYLGACHGMDDAALSDTLLRAGAKTVMAYSNSVYTSYDDEMCGEVFKNLSTPDGEGVYPTAEEACNAAKKKLGKTDSSDLSGFMRWLNKVIDGKLPAELLIAGSTNFRLSDRTGLVSGRVCKAASREDPIPLAAVNAKSKTTGKQWIALTGANGNYSIYLPEDDYDVTIKALGYVDFHAQIEVRANRTLYMETFLIVWGSAADEGIAEGKVVNSLTGRGEPDVKLTLKKDWNARESDKTVCTLRTNEEGFYATETLPIGNYTVFVEKDEFLTSSFNIVVEPGSLGNQNGTITPEVAGNQILVTLTWDANPKDLDSHVEGTLTNGGWFHIDYHYSEDRNYSPNYVVQIPPEDAGVTVCRLDYDDIDQYGPEHITLIPLEGQVYYYYVHRYEGSGTLGGSFAKVQVHRGNELIAEFNVPTDQGNGDYWNVFAIMDGEITVSNTITGTPYTDYVRVTADVD